jgi:hypothetical protein
MQMEHSEYIKLQDQLQDHFDGRYRKIDDCDEIVSGFRKDIHKDDRRLVAIESQLNLVLWVLMAVGGGIITMLVKMFFGG